MNIIEMYNLGLSITDLNKETGISLSTLRRIILEAGVLRNRKDAIRLAAKQGKLTGGQRKGAKISPGGRKNMSIAAKKRWEGKAKGFAKKPNGYIEITIGPNKGRSEHVVIVEEHIGRRLYINEVVHHINGIRDDNNIGNLQLMTRKEHCRLHAKINNKNRNRNNKGQFN